MEAPTVVMKVPMILFWIFGEFKLVSKIELDLNQFLDSQIHFLFGNIWIFEN